MKVFGCHREIGKKSDTVLNRRLILDQFITKGKGIEIGALHNPVRLRKGIHVRYLDRLSVAQLRRHYPELEKFKMVKLDIIADGETLAAVKSFSQDFVIANHFLEHCQNPIETIENMMRVLKTGGILYMAIPDKRYTFDAERPVTPYEHLLNDYIHGPEESGTQHYEEWIRFVNKTTDNVLVLREIEYLKKISYSIHFHVWTQNEIIELVLRQKKKYEIELISINGGEVIVVLQKE